MGLFRSSSSDILKNQPLQFFRSEAMELGSLVWFSSRKHPFAVRERHCLDLRCPCIDAWLTFTEVDLGGGELRPPLSFEIRINLRDGREREPPVRSAEEQALVREFLVRFPGERFEELVRRRQEQRSAQERLEAYPIDNLERGTLLCYSDVIYEQGGVAKNGHRFSFFFHHEGRDYLIEDHYCPSPSCDCREVHVEFWERIESARRSPRVDVRQRLMAAFTLEGRFERLTFSKEEPPRAEQLCRAWRDPCGHQLEEFRRRYQQIKALGQRRRDSSAATSSAGQEKPLQPLSPQSREVLSLAARVGRNELCPCGSGQKFKRCCGRHSTSG
jgi:hypothetical protein